MKALEAHELYRFFHVENEETLALKGVSLTVEAGEMVAVEGPSGSGKSTLVNCLAGLDEPDGGWVAIMGQRITRRPESERAVIRARSLGILLQSGNLIDHLTVEDNVRLAMQLAARSDEGRLNALIERVGIEHVRRARPFQISGGEAARAALVVALVSRPAVLLADEPTGEVDAETEQKILHLLDLHRREGGGVLLVTHSEAAAASANRRLQLLDGKVVGHA